MLHLKDVSLGYKIPLRVAALVVVTASVLASVLVYRNIVDLRDNMKSNAYSLGRVLADTLVEPILHDDVWRAFEIINTPFRIQRDKASSQNAEFIVILDATNKVFVSTRPQQFPIMSDQAVAESRFASLLGKPPVNSPFEPVLVDSAGLDSLYQFSPIQSDGVLLGTLIVSYSKSPIELRFYNLIRTSILITLLVLAGLLPFGVYWGRKMAAPLLRLSYTMGNISPHLPDPQQVELEESKDEIGLLSTSFKTMLAALKEKELLQQQVIASDRLAAIGRLAAGIAHEINNPLGGMLNSISTYKRHGNHDVLTMRTMSILERGLLQIKDTVSALLVEAKPQVRPLDLNDIADICTLVQPDIEKKQVNFSREIDIMEAQPVPSTLVRQVIINLLLNAIHATKHQGHVHLHIYRDSSHLFIHVLNDGAHISQEKLSYLFEPVTSLSEHGNGLGLWVIYQIVQQLGGIITVLSEPNETRFTIQLPLQEPHE